MAKGLIGGMTDYSHQSFNNIIDDTHFACGSECGQIKIFNFDEILKYSYNSEILNQSISVRIRVSPDMKNDYKSVENMKFVLNERTKVNEAIFHGKVSHTVDGKIFGLIGYETGITPKGRNNEVNTPVGVRGESLGFEDFAKDDVLKLKELGFSINSPIVN